MSDPELTSRRGTGMSSHPGSMGVFLAKAGGIDDVSAALANEMSVARQIDAWGNSRQVTGFAVWQYRGDPWSTFYFQVSASQLAALARRLGVPVIHFGDEDTSGWTGYALDHQGKIQEKFQFGPDYSEEMEKCYKEFAEEGESEEAAPTRGELWDLDFTDDEGTPYQFRSLHRQVSTNEALDFRQFIDAFLRSQDAWIPDWDNAPSSESNTATEAGGDEFARVDFGPASGEYLRSFRP